MALAMRHGVLPKTLHLDEPSPHVDWDSGAVELLGEAQPWEPNEPSPPRRRLLLRNQRHQRPPDLGGGAAPRSRRERRARRSEPPASCPLVPLPLSAKGEDALREQAARLAAHLQSNPELSLADVGFSLATTRATLEHRATVLGADREELLEALGALGAGKPHPGLVQGRAATGKLAFLFSGQGAQRPGMGKELYESESFPAFSAALDEICAELDPLLGRSLKDLLFAKEKSKKAALLDRTEFTQPALFALEVALFRQLQAWDLTPDYLLGHSIGELSAAHVAGVLSLPGACKLIAARGALMGALPEGGAMVAIEAGEEEISPDLPAGLSIAGINAPNSVVVSGPEGPALELAEHWKQKGRKTTRLRVSHAFHSELMEPMLEEFAAVAQTIDYKAPQLPVLSNLTGELLTPEQATDPAYWVSQVREPVRFADGAAHLAEQGVATCLELGPDGVLCAMAAGSFAAAEKEAVALPLLRKDRPEAAALLGALAGAQANGAPFEWQRLFPGASRVPLPTYAFQRQRYWLEPRAAEADVTAAGLGTPDHPLLGAATSLPAEAGWLLTGRLSLQTHPWLTDHAVHGSAILPGTAFVEMALKAAEQSGAEGIEELTLEAPLILPEQGAVQVQVSVGAADEAGSRSVQIHSRPEDADDPDREWVANAGGLLGAVGVAEPQDLLEWPPAGAELLGIDELYERGADLGLDYGPAFQGVKAAWRRGEEIFAEVELDEEQASQAESFGIHPALLDAALHPTLMVADEVAAEGPRVPFAWNGVRLRRGGASKLRIALAPAADETLGLRLADSAGEPLASVAAIAVRSLPAAQLVPQGQGGSLFRLDWAEQSLPEPEAEGPEVVALTPDPSLDPATAARALCEEVLATLQEAIAAGEDTRIAFLTEGAVAVGAGESPDPAAASVWGLVRSAQAEHPGRFLLIDTDGSEVSKAALAAALAIESEPQLALREGAALAARLVRSDGEANEPQPLDPEATVLITGATGTLGALFARHLVVAHGARHLLLSSRRGAEAPGALELAEELSELGAAVDVVACDVAERSQLAQLLDSIPQEHPLGAVVHAAGVLDDGVVESLTPERLATVMAPKAAAAWNLHELTRELELLRLRPLLLDRRLLRWSRSRQLRRRQLLPRCPRPAAQRRRPSRLLDRLGPLGAGERDDPRARRDRPGEDRSRRNTAPAPRRGHRALRPQPHDCRPLPPRRRSRRRRAPQGGPSRGAGAALLRPRPHPRPSPGRRRVRRPRSPPRRDARSRPRGRRPGVGRRARRRRARPRLRRRDRHQGRLQGSRLRLARCGRTAQPAQRRHRAATALDPGLRPPDPRGGRGVSVEPGLRERSRWPGSRPGSGPDHGDRRVDRRRGEGARDLAPAGPSGDRRKRTPRRRRRGP